jgi:SRSO17 transposase
LFRENFFGSPVIFFPRGEMPELEAMQKITEVEVTGQLRKYLESYKDCFARSQQIRYFETFVKGLLSNLDGKSIEPIVLSFLGEKDVRGMQQFFTRSRGWDEAVGNQYKMRLAGPVDRQRRLFKCG